MNSTKCSCTDSKLEARASHGDKLILVSSPGRRTFGERNLGPVLLEGSDCCRLYVHVNTNPFHIFQELACLAHWLIQTNSLELQLQFIVWPFNLLQQGHTFSACKLLSRSPGQEDLPTFQKNYSFFFKCHTIDVLGTPGLEYMCSWYCNRFRTCLKDCTIPLISLSPAEGVTYIT